MRRAALTLALAAPALAPQVEKAPVPSRPCKRRFTVGDYERWVRGHEYRGRIRDLYKPRMWTLERCQQGGAVARLTAIRWRVRFLRGVTFELTHPFRDATVSWYEDAGSTASGMHYHFGFAACGYGLCVPMGTRIEFCYRGRCVDSQRDDSGPYVGGRAYDLNQNTAGAIGFDGVATVRYRVLP